MLFITNKMPTNKIPGKIRFNPYDNLSSHELYCCERNGKNSYSELGGPGLMERIKTSKYKQVLFYIHGFNNYMEDDVFPRAEKLQGMFDEYSPGMIEVVPIIWPTSDKVGMMRDYYSDQQSADNSAFSFARLFQKFFAWQSTQEESCMKRMNMLVHSMGNRVLRESIKSWVKYDQQDGAPLLFRNTFLFAADMVNETLEKGKPGEHICDASRNVITYYASDDLALRSSKATNLKNMIASRRLGHSGPEDMNKVSQNVFAIDCDNFNNKYDFPKGHSYFLENGEGKPGEAFLHMADCIKSGRVKHDEGRKLIL